MVVHHLAGPSSADGGDVVVTRLGFIDPAYAFGLLRWLELPDPIAATNIL
ncbi:MAG: hypothetical protein ACOYL9_07950 [Ilumatobacteraceae bacterium]